MNVVINGEQRELEDDVVLADLLRLLDLPTDSVAAAVNGEIVSRDQFDELKLDSGDRIELVRPMAGGSGEGMTDAG